MRQLCGLDALSHREGCQDAIEEGVTTAKRQQNAK